MLSFNSGGSNQSRIIILFSVNPALSLAVLGNWSTDLIILKKKEFNIKDSARTQEGSFYAAAVTIYNFLKLSLHGWINTWRFLLQLNKMSYYLSTSCIRGGRHFYSWQKSLHLKVSSNCGIFFETSNFNNISQKCAIGFPGFKANNTYNVITYPLFSLANTSTFSLHWQYAR